MPNVFLGQVVKMDLDGKKVVTDLGHIALMPDGCEFGSYIGMDDKRNSYVLSEAEKKLHLKGKNEKSEERLALEEEARYLGVEFQSNIGDAKLKAKIEEAKVLQSQNG